ncbi:MAG: sulfatase [Opitutales bacterium]|nr:sulfatase [Opitutales bacterium]
MPYLLISSLVGLLRPRSAVFSCFVLLALFFGLLPLRANDRPNILLIFPDDHTWQTISAYGHPLSKVVPTPNIDRIADEGIRFDRCLVTNSICAPSRAVVLTGKYSHLNGQINNYNTFDGSQVTFPQLLQKEGYQTAIVGKWHLKSVPTGFDYHEVMRGQGRYYNPILYTDGEPTEYEGYNTDVVVDRSLNWLKNRDSDQPFMLMCQFKATHGPFQPALRHLGELDDVSVPVPDNFFDDYSGRSRAPGNHNTSIAKVMPLSNLSLDYRNIQGEQLAQFRSHFDEANEAFEKADLQGDALANWRYQRFIKNFLLTSKAIDENVGRVLDYLDESGLAENTIVIYAADQGFFLGEHGWYDKRWMYEESLKTPFMVRWPGVTQAGRVSRDIVSNLDFAPMFLEMAGASIPAEIQGRSLVPILKGSAPRNWRKSFYYKYYGERFGGSVSEGYYNHGVPPHEGVADAQYKLIHFKHDDVDEWELFDHERDPGEMKSEYDNPEYAQVVARLKEELNRLKRYYKVEPSEG